MLASYNVVMIQMVLDIVMSTSETQIITVVRAMTLAIKGMTAVQMHQVSAGVSECH